MDATAWIAAISAAVALGALYFTWEQAKNAKRQTDLQQRMHEDAAQPYVWADLRPTDDRMHLMRLLVCNDGPTVATDVLVTFDPPLPRKLRAEEVQAEYRIAAMPPGRRMSWSLNTGPDWIQGSSPKRFTVTITATGPFGPVTPNVYELDVDEYRGVDATPPGTLYGIDRAIKDLTSVVREQRGR
jgi:hypothetical protein